MLPIPPHVSITFLTELIGCSLYLVFILILSTCREIFLKTAFFKLFYSTGLAGIGTVATYWLFTLMTYLPVQPDNQILIYFGQATNGGATFSYTCGKLLIVLNRLAVLDTIKSSINKWNDKQTKILIVCQFVIPLIAHLYFIFVPIYWVNGLYAGLDNTTGSIYRGITGIFYASFAIVGVFLNILSFYRLHRLVKGNSLSSVNFYKQQRSLAIYTFTSTASHILFALHQFAWSYTFIIGDRDMLTIVRGVRVYFYDLTTFTDPIVLVCLSRQVRTALHRRIFGRYQVHSSSNQFSLSVNPI